MPSLLRHRICPVCGLSHNFCLNTGFISTGQTFSFLCPNKNRRGLFHADAMGEMSRFYMEGAISLERLANNRQDSRRQYELIDEN